MKKRMLAALLAAALLVSLAPAALAAAPAEEEAAQVLAALDIMVGGEDGELNLNSTVTRAEFTKMAIASSSMRHAVGDSVSVKPYPDVPQNHWAAPYVKVAVDLGLVQGDLWGNFNPERTITLAEGVTIVLRLLGYQDSDFSGVWPSGQMAQYSALKLDQGVSCGANDAMTRRDALYLFYNLMVTQNKAGQYYLNVLEPTLNLVSPTGELDRVALINSAMDGPVVVSRGWQGQIPFDLSNATVYRAGSPSTLTAIQDQDVVYWSKSMRTIWAYTGKVTGIYENVSPSSSSPAAVTVAGKTYSIETPSAVYDLSDLGPYKVGDNVTLLLGRNDGVAAVTEPGQSATLLYGVITQIADLPYDDGANGTYNAQTVSIMATDGNTYNYQLSNKRLKVGAVVRVNASEGNFQIQTATSSKLTGRVSNDAATLGNYTLASNVEILDTYESCTPIRIYPSRLAGVNLTANMVRFYALNAQGEIAYLILNDVTGDLHQYGVITSVSEISASMVTTSTYVYDVGGQTMVSTSDTTIYNLKTGPCQVKLEGPQTVERLYNLTELKVDGISGDKVLSNYNQEYTISENVAVYIKDVDGDFQLTSLARVLEGDYTLTAWYDKAENTGGRVRVIIAR